MSHITDEVVEFLRILRVLFFLAGITLPQIGFFFQWQVKSGLQSNDKQIDAPVLTASPDQWGKYVLDSRAYFNEQFGFRGDLIRLNSTIKFNWLGVAPNTKVAVGKQGWLYLGNYEESIVYGRNLRPFEQHELDTWKRILERRRDELKEKGIQYIFVLVPTAASIYPEYLPNWFTPANPKSRVDQLIEYMNEKSNVKILDLRPALLAAKGDIPLYYRTDSHWNPYGACIAHGPLIDALREWFPNIPPYSANDFSVEKNPNMFYGDLLRVGGFSGVAGEDEISVIPKQNRRAKRVTLDWGKERDLERQPFATEQDSDELPRAVIFRDSFFIALQPFVSETFRRAVFVWQKEFSSIIVNDEECDVVIQEMVDRFLLLPPPIDSYGRL